MEQVSADAKNFPKKNSGSLDFPAENLPGKKIKEPRYITVEQKRTALKTTNNRCSYPNCHRPYDLFHHPERYSIVQNHNQIVPLCKEHHEFAHNGLMGEHYQVDEKYKTHRRLALVN